MALTDKLTAIADAIRTKTGSTDSMTLDEMATAVGNITGDGGTVTTDSADALVDKSITEYSSDTLISIGDYEFYNCTSLTSVNAPNVANVGNSAFNSCKALTNIELLSVTSMGISVFGYCSKLQTISIPNVTSIGESAFSNCTFLATVDTSKVESIGSSAFYYCTLTHFDLSSCTNLSTKAFHYNTALRKVWLPSTCTTVSASSYSYSPFYRVSSECEIYTDVADEDSIPEGWGGNIGTTTVQAQLLPYTTERHMMNIRQRKTPPPPSLRALVKQSRRGIKVTL